MLRKLFILIFVFFISNFLNTVYAQQFSQRWVCLKSERSNVHEATISVSDKSEERPLPNSDTYIFECFTNSLCTSGNSNLDIKVFNKNNYSQMQAEFNYKFEKTTLPSNPIKSDSNGYISPFKWQSSSVYHSRRWLAMNYVEPKNELGAGEEKTIQVGSFDLETVFSKSDCVSLNWDPYGRVFDAYTLEPVSDVNVTLLVKRQNGSFTPFTPNDILGGNIINPQKTLVDGMFSFVVPDGTYKLKVESNDYIFPVEFNKINSNYSKIYQNIYPALTGEEIVQKGSIQKRDIPLIPKSSSQSNEVKLMEYFMDLDKKTSTIIIQGRASHPFTKIKAYSLKTDPVTNQQYRFRLLIENPITTDNQGKFILKISQTNFENDEFFGDLVLEKSNLTSLTSFKNIIDKLLSFIFKKVKAQTVLASSYRFEPILNYIEGYAYDNQGNIIPNAKVSVVLNFSNSPSYTINADDRGYFKISSQYLPSMPYRLVFTNSVGEKNEIKTSKFIAQNQKYLKESGININNIKIIKNDTNTTSITSSVTSSSSKISPSVINFNNKNKDLNNFNDNNQLIKNSNSQNFKFLSILLLLIFLIILVALIIFLYIKKNKTY